MTTIFVPGSNAALTRPGDIHEVANATPGLAISLHIYGANIAALGSRVRRRYTLPVHGRSRGDGTVTPVMTSVSDPVLR